MRYPTISSNEMERLSVRLLDGETSEIEGSTKWIGASPDLELADLDEAVGSIRKAWEAGYQHLSTPKARDEMEGKAALLLYGGLASTPVDVLDDPGFWRYVTARLWWFVDWREEAIDPMNEWAKYRVYVDGRNHADCVTVRMYLRGRLATEGGVPALAHEIEEAADLWRSHIVRVRTSYSPFLTAGLLRQQMADRMTTNPLRAYARRLNRLASNVVLRTYADDQIVDGLLDELR